MIATVIGNARIPLIAFMKKEKEIKISYWAAHATTIVSVTLVLLIIGIIALVGVSARQETRRLKESLEVSVIMNDSISDAAASKVMASMKSLGYCRNLKLITKAQAMQAWKEETGEDLEALFGVNPLSPEISFTLPENYSSADSLRRIEKALSLLPGVEDVATPAGETVAAMNENIGKMSAILGGIAVVMLLISFVLINNTVHLTIYARRFIIHTMQLVGATNGFIRRPVVVRNLCAGLIAGALASALLAGALLLAPRFGFSDIGNFISWEVFAIVVAGIIVIGALICSMAALIATTHYLGKDYNQLVTGA